MKTFFFGDHLSSDEKTDSNWSKIDYNLGQDRLMFYPVSKTAPTEANSWLRAWLHLCLIGSIGYQVNQEKSSIGCSTEPVDRTGMRPFDTDVTSPMILCDKKSLL